MGIFQLQNRAEIRQPIGRNLGIVIIGEATSTVDTSSLIDTKNLLGGNDEHNQKEVIIYSATGSIVDGETSIVDDFVGSSNDATMAPVFTASITDGDKYEMWQTPWRIADINDAINQAINEATTLGALVSRVTTSNFTLEGHYTYDWLVPYAFGNDFKSLYKVEYVSSIGTSRTIHNCEVVWDELVDTDVTASVDSTYNIEGNYALKLVVAAGAGAGDILATDDISSLDISDCDQIEIFTRSSTALDAGDLQVLLDDTASCASPVESLDIPATLANTNTHHVIDLANPHLDTAIISVGIKMVTDKGAFTLYVDRIRAVQSATKRYIELSDEYWFINRGSSPTLSLTSEGLSGIGADKQVRLSGFSAPDIFSDDTTDSEVDPSYLIAKVTGRLLVSHAKSSFLDIHDRARLSTYWLGEAARMESRIITSLPGTSREVEA